MLLGCVDAAADVFLRNPITGITACCGRTACGHAAAPLSSVWTLAASSFDHLVRTRARELRRVHWSKEASSLGFAHQYWSWIKFICYRIIGTTMEAIIRRRCCHFGGN